MHESSVDQPFTFHGFDAVSVRDLALSVCFLPYTWFVGADVEGWSIIIKRAENKLPGSDSVPYSGISAIGLHNSAGDP